MFFVADIDKEHGVADMNVQLFFGDAEESCGTLHVACDAAGIGQAFDEHLSGFEQQVELASQ